MRAPFQTAMSTFTWENLPHWIKIFRKQKVSNWYVGRGPGSFWTHEQPSGKLGTQMLAGLKREMGQRKAPTLSSNMNGDGIQRVAGDSWTQHEEAGRHTPIKILTLSGREEKRCQAWQVGLSLTMQGRYLFHICVFYKQNQTQASLNGNRLHQIKF